MMNLESCVKTEKKSLLSVEAAQQRIHAAIIPLIESDCG